MILTDWERRNHKKILAFNIGVMVYGIFISFLQLVGGL